MKSAHLILSKYSLPALMSCEALMPWSGISPRRLFPVCQPKTSVLSSKDVQSWCKERRKTVRILQTNSTKDVLRGNDERESRPQHLIRNGHGIPK